ncbi:TPA: cytosine permease [Pseudomonas aeruginosa]|nr:cytosine permease [Pseudomonas aeruginosa]HDU8989841.1 cytosine permease [Pseudomonas aeruginosa]HDU9120744.1 cytosine permease [Pseudomonas aeruginosa]HEJ2803095.1 cytosine permease [Pseudomonas aeruginosa]HEK0026597.1 cytosine permease [Pseudomonas aeruginosa]
MWTCCTFSAATWAFLIGSYLPIVGDWRLGVMGYLIGSIIGMVVVTLASGLPSHKYGFDVIDTSKSSFGYRGIVVPLLALLSTQIGWSYVVQAMTARGAANIVSTVRGLPMEGGGHEYWVVIIGLFVLALVWLITSKGPTLFERINAYIGPMHMVITVIMLWMLVREYGWTHLWVTQAPADQMLSHDPVQGLALAVEFGMASSLGWWPVIGGITRLVDKRKHVIGPTVVGVGVLGAAFISTVAAVASISAGTYDPTIWMIKIAGPVLGTVVMSVVLAANIATMVIMMYIAGVSIQQIKIFQRLRWEAVVGAILLPGIYVAFRTEWLLSSVMNMLSYTGVIYVGITAIGFTDYFLLRKTQLSPIDLLAADGDRYKFWSGTNWAAVAVTCLATFSYLDLFNPVTSEMSPYFKYLGASIPVLFVASAAYYLLVRLIVIPAGKGAYPAILMNRGVIGSA